MNLIQQIIETQDEFVAIRQHIHENPELGFQEFNTSKLITKLLKEYGYEVHNNIAKTGVVGVLKKGDSTKAIGLRADMDALPIQEENNISYKSKKDGIMHACGHDGHIAALLMTAKYLAKCNFNGTINLYFQPAEEGIGGALCMLQEGLFERFPSDMIFSWHNIPMDSNKIFYLKSGAMMASSDHIKIEIYGKGGHASAPEKTRDSIYAAACLILELQGIISRNIAPQDCAVISIAGIHAGNGQAYNVIPDDTTLLLSVRTLDSQIRDMILNRIQTVCNGIATIHNVTVTTTFDSVAAVTYNDEQASVFATKIARDIFGEENCEFHHKPLMASEDFSFMLQKVPGAYAFFNNGNTPYVHNTKYIFNDDILPLVATYFSKLALEYLQ